MARGHTIRHSTDRNCVRVVPIMSKPIDTSGKGAYKICPTCQIHHPVKSLHLWLGPTGECLISDGVLDLLKLAGPAWGMEPMDGFTIEGVTKKPPPLRIGKDADRQRVDDENRKQVVYNRKQLTTKGAISNG